MSIPGNISPASDRIFFVVSKTGLDNGRLAVKQVDLKAMSASISQTEKLKKYIEQRRFGYIDEFNKAHLAPERVQQLNNVIDILFLDSSKKTGEEVVSRSILLQNIDDEEYSQFNKLIRTHFEETSCIKSSENEIIKPFFNASYSKLSVQFTLHMHTIISRCLDAFADNIRENDQRKEDEYQRSLINELYKISEILNKYLKKWNLKQDFFKARL